MVVPDFGTVLLLIVLVVVSIFCIVEIRHSIRDKNSGTTFLMGFILLILLGVVAKLATDFLHFLQNT